MIELTVNAIKKGDRINVASNGVIEGDGKMVLYEMLNVIERFDDISGGAILAKALEMWLDEKGVK